MSASAQKDSWNVVKYSGREYVTDDNTADFYRFPRFSKSGNNRIFQSETLMMRWTIGSQSVYINNIKFSLSFPIAESNGRAMISTIDLSKLVDPVLRPKYIKKKKFTKVVIDPGHGDHDSGAKGLYGYEKNYTLDMSLRLKRALEKRGLKVEMTRSTDVFLSLGQRVAYANRVSNSVFVSIHFNSSNASASGIETYALAPQYTASTNGGSASGSFNAGNVQDSENIALATAVHAMVMHKMKSADRGIKRARFNVLRGINKPAILFEGGFVTNPSESKKINDANYREQVAEAIADGVMNFRKAVSK